MFPQFEQLFSKRDESIHPSAHELESLNRLVSCLLECRNVSIELLDGFVFSYSIPHIGKEFDLLMMSDDVVLNIELKSANVTDEKICSQLEKNYYYLNFIEGKRIELFSFTAQEETFKRYLDGSLRVSNVMDLVEVLRTNFMRYKGDFDDLFREKKYLVSPINDVNNFIHGNYFLTQQQQEIKNEILRKKSERTLDGATYKISGVAGTGKTLLLYDLAKSIKLEKKSCVIHCGQLADGHYSLNRSQNDFAVISVKACETIELQDYGALFVDECHRFRLSQFNKIAEKIKALNLPSFFFLDQNQVLQVSEMHNDISRRIVDEFSGTFVRELSKKIRTNKEIASFIRKLFLMKGYEKEVCFRNIEILFAGNIEEAKRILDFYRSNGYQYVYYTPSQYKRWDGDIWTSLAEGYSTHNVIGQEFDKVIIPMDRNFFFEGERLKSLSHPYNEYLLPKMLFQGLTRAREKLAILVFDNSKLFEGLLKIIN